MQRYGVRTVQWEGSSRGRDEPEILFKVVSTRRMGTERNRETNHHEERFGRERRHESIEVADCANKVYRLVENEPRGRLT